MSEVGFLVVASCGGTEGSRGGGPVIEVKVFEVEFLVVACCGRTECS
jgi:hypothetical protein